MVLTISPNPMPSVVKIIITNGKTTSNDNANTLTPRLSPKNGMIRLCLLRTGAVGVVGVVWIVMVSCV